ncbi:sugar ABC transporter permease [Paenibacillus barcinonensis]|uniref:Putative aldouronate transport system permease protein n=2 Tax=Paenibacillus barcinonensis TaxID=198119 RepID=A0A2V4VTB5_PAEBA|nr:putative aldouronate transport system permease protein [Paenibacillus barcinonensis]QKS59885.1 sugar ABC transporter permease [Paenibacillus barcinonensis]
MTEKRKTSSGLKKRLIENKLLYIMLAPCLLFFILFSYLPMAGLVMAFKEFKFNEGMFGGPWVGLRYFKLFFSYPEAGQLIWNTFMVGFIKIVLYFPFPIILAIMLHELRSKRFKSVTQTISYLPYFLSWVVVVAFTNKVLAPDSGIFNQLIAALGGDGGTFYLMEGKYFYPIMFLTHLWKNIGWGSIVYLAAIAGIDPTLYEAAEMDGASKWRKIWHITLTGIRPAVGVLFILEIGSLLSTGYEQNFLLRTAGNAEYADILDTYVLRVGMMQGQYGYASAVGLLQGIVGLILVITVNKLVRKYSQNEASLW